LLVLGLDLRRKGVVVWWWRSSTTLAFVEDARRMNLIAAAVNRWMNAWVAPFTP
jgi:hypothetical protein